MGKPPAFFVPAATVDKQESVYAELAEFGRSFVAPIQQRIYSITYTHEGDEWTATVGESLIGVRYQTSRIKGVKIDRKQHLGDPAIVLAIFAGHPYIVVTNHRLAGNVGSRWENPFMAGRPTSITYFQST